MQQYLSAEKFRTTTGQLGESSEAEPLLPKDTIQWDRVTTIAGRVQEGALHYSKWALALGLLSFAGYGVMNYFACRMFLTLAKNGAEYLPNIFGLAWNTKSSGPSAFAMNFTLNQYFYVFVFKMLCFFGLVENLRREEDIAQGRSNWRLSLQWSLVTVIAVASAVLMLAMGNDVDDTIALDVFNMVVFTVANLIGAESTRKKIADAPKNLKAFWHRGRGFSCGMLGYLFYEFMLTCQQAYYLVQRDLRNISKEQLGEAPIGDDFRTPEEKFLDALKTVRADAIEQNDESEFSSSTYLVDRVKDIKTKFETREELSWGNSNARYLLLLLLIGFCQYCTGVTNIGMIANTFTFLLKHLAMLPKEWAKILAGVLTGILCTSFSTLSWDLVNFSTTDFYGLFEVILQKTVGGIYGLMQWACGCCGKQSLLPTTMSDTIPKTVPWYKTLVSGSLTAIALVAVLVGIYVALQSSGTGLYLLATAGLGFTGFWKLKLPNYISHINFNAQGNNVMWLSGLGTANSYIFFSKDKRQRVSYSHANLIGDQKLLGSDFSNFEDLFAENPGLLTAAPR